MIYWVIVLWFLILLKFCSSLGSKTNNWIMHYVSLHRMFLWWWLVWIIPKDTSLQFFVPYNILLNNFLNLMSNFCIIIVDSEFLCAWESYGTFSQRNKNTNLQKSKNESPTFVFHDFCFVTFSFEWLHKAISTQT